MSINVGDIVRHKPSGKLGRACMVSSAFCQAAVWVGEGDDREVRVELWQIGDVEPASGEAPDCP